MLDFVHSRSTVIRSALTAAAGLILLLGILAFADTHAEALYILTGVEDSAIILENSSAVPDLSDQIINIQSNRTGHEIWFTAGQQVSVLHNGTTRHVITSQESVSTLLRRLGIRPTALDMVGVDLSGNTAQVTVSPEIVYYDRVQEAAKHTTLRVPNDNMLAGTEKVVQPGVDGTRTSVYEVVWSNGKQVSRQFVEEYDVDVTPEIVEFGTRTPMSSISRSDRIQTVTKNADGSGTLLFQSGSVLKFKAVKSMTATAYTADEPGTNHITAMGTPTHVGVVAVDKRVIPLGTKLYIVCNGGIVYGTAVAEDTGVHGNVIDLYHDTYRQCINFGRRGCTVYIIDE